MLSWIPLGEFRKVKNLIWWQPYSREMHADPSTETYIGGTVSSVLFTVFFTKPYNRCRQINCGANDTITEPRNLKKWMFTQKYKAILLFKFFLYWWKQLCCLISCRKQFFFSFKIIFYIYLFIKETWKKYPFCQSF